MSETLALGIINTLDNHRGSPTYCLPLDDQAISNTLIARSEYRPPNDSLLGFHGSMMLDTGH